MKIVTKIKWLLLIIPICALYTGNANAYLVNMDAEKNGYSKPVKRTLAAGTYEIIPVSGKYDAWTAWDLSNPKHPVCGDTNGCDRSGSGPKIIGWLNSYGFESPYLVDVTINGLAATPASGDLYKVNPEMAYPDADSALAHAWSAEFTLTKASTVNFMVLDSNVHDNAGGISLHVVPEPSILALMALGLVGIGFSNRKKS